MADKLTDMTAVEKMISGLMEDSTNTDGFVAPWVVSQMMELYAKRECIAVLESIKTYHQENGNIGFAYDDRTSEELYQIYVESKTEQL